MLPGRPALWLALMSLAALSGCSLPVTGGADDRVAEVRTARERLVTPVSALDTEAQRLAGAVEELWRAGSSPTERGARAASLRLAPFEDAAAAVAASDLSGRGPDVTAVRDLVRELGDGAQALLTAAEEEVAALERLADVDVRLAEVAAGFDARGSYSRQLQALEQAGQDAESLAAEASGRTATPSCTDAWVRRGQAAMTLAGRAEELRALVRDRRGQEFDELRDAYRTDPFGLGRTLAEADAAAAADCWTEGSAVAQAADGLHAVVDELAAVLDPEDL